MSEQTTITDAMVEAAANAMRQFFIAQGMTPDCPIEPEAFPLIRAALEAVERVKADALSWRPIETYHPFTGEVLVSLDHCWVMTARRDDVGRWFASSGGIACYPDDGSDGEYKLVRVEIFPTHWQAKPAPALKDQK